MNAPLPIDVTRGTAARGLTASRGPHAVDTARLARGWRARRKARCCSTPPSRGRYATDASIYQVMPVGVFVPRTQRRRRASRIDIARELKVPLVPRGAGTSQCGQTIGAALVIDNSKHLRRVLDVDAEALHRRGRARPRARSPQRAAEAAWPVVPGRRLDQRPGHAGRHGRQQLLRLALASPTATWCTTCWASTPGCPTARAARFGPVDEARATARADRRVRARAGRASIAPRSRRAGPRCCAASAATTSTSSTTRASGPTRDDGSVNLAHLLVGSEGTLAFTKQPDAASCRRCRGAKVLGVVNFPSFHAAMDAAQHIVKLGPERGGAGRPHHDRAGLRQPGLSRHDRDGADRRAGRHPAGRVHRRRPSRAAAAAEGPGRADGRPRPAGRVVEMPDEAPQKALWEVRKAGLNIMMSLKGDGKPVSFIEDCAVPLEHLAEYTDALTEVFARHGTRGTWYAHASVGTLHVRPILDMRRDGAIKMRAIAEEASALVRKFKGAYSGEHGDGLCRGEWIAWQFGPAINEAFRAIKNRLDPIGLFKPEQDRRSAEDGRRARCSAFRPDTGRSPLKPVLDWSAWNVQNDPGDRRDLGAGQRRRPRRRLRQGGGDVQQQRPLPQVRRRHDVPELSRHARRAAPDPRPRQHLAAGAVGSARRRRLASPLASDAVAAALDLCVGCKGCKRDCPTGVDMARMKIECHGRTQGPARLHAQGPLDRGVCPTIAGTASRMPGLANLRNRSALLARLGERWLGLSARRSLPRWRRDTFWHGAPALALADRETALAADKAVVLFVDTFNGPLRDRERNGRSARAASRGIRRARGRTARRRRGLLRPHLSRCRHAGSGQGQGARVARRTAALRRTRHRASSASNLHVS